MFILRHVPTNIIMISKRTVQFERHLYDFNQVYTTVWAPASSLMFILPTCIIRISRKTVQFEHHLYDLNRESLQFKLRPAAMFILQHVPTYITMISKKASVLMFILLYVPTSIIMFRKERVQFVGHLYDFQQGDTTVWALASGLMFILLYLPTCFIMIGKKTVQFEHQLYDFQ